MGQKRMVEIIALDDDSIPETDRMEKDRFARGCAGLFRVRGKGEICPGHI